ncbi:MAG: hypothetical protein JXR10_14780 [Cyclobacteriaceae bacterium]
MTLQDLFVTPIYLLLLLGLAYYLRPFATDHKTRKYYYPALLLKFFGAIAVGLIYQFYYGGGDTFTYFHLGSKHVHDAFMNDPFVGLSMIFGNMEYTPENFEYAQQIYTYGDSASYAVVRFASFFDIFTFHTYLATALLFAALSFTGIWMTYLVFVGYYPRYSRQLAWSILFFPSLFFWGSGLLKDTITLAAVGWLFYGIVQIGKGGVRLIPNLVLVLIAAYTLFVIKIYILICLLPALGFWFFIRYQTKVRNQVLRILIVPVLVLLGIGSAYGIGLYLGEFEGRYSLENVIYTAEQTAKWNYYVSNRDGGSGYSLGDYDFSTSGLVRKFLPAVGTTFFRPFLWEVRNPVMLLAAMENTLILSLVLICIRRYSNWKILIKEPLLTFCIVFAILFSFAIGVTTYNFGSLVRYKIPMLVFFVPTIYLMSRRRLII